MVLIILTFLFKLASFLVLNPLKFYLEELEKEKKFEGFLDFCQTFPLVRGKSVADEEDRSVGEFKVTKFLNYRILLKVNSFLIIGFIKGYV